MTLTHWREQTEELKAFVQYRYRLIKYLKKHGKAPLAVTQSKFKKDTLTYRTTQKKYQMKKTTWKVQSTGFRGWVQTRKAYKEARLSPGKQWKAKSMTFRKFVAAKMKTAKRTKPRHFLKLTSWRKQS